MGIYIKGMGTPRNCMVCPLHHYYFPPTTIADDNPTVKAVSVCMATRKEIADGQVGCPLVHIPPHGDLIEREAICLTDFEIAMCGGDYKEGMKMLLEKIESAPTIIGAEVDK